MAASTTTAFTSVPARSSTVCQALHRQHLRVHPLLGRQKIGLTLRQQTGRNASRTSSSPLLSTFASSEFAQREASQLADFLNEELAKYHYLSDVKGRIADVCSKALHNYVVTYSGGIEGKPIEDMKKALLEQGLPHQQALTCSIWWLRVNLRKDWEQYSAAK